MASILIVDDVAQNRQLMRALLEHAGYRVCEAADGSSGLAMATSDRPDLILCDILMPVFDGFEFVRRLRGDPDVWNIPVVFCSANYLESEARGLATQCQVTHFLSKPCDAEVILRTVAAALESGPLTERPTAPAPTDFHRRHVEVVTDKLAQKVRELEELNVELEQRVAARTDELRLANEDLKAFTYSVSHELRAPVRAVSSFAAILRQESAPALDENARSLVSRIEAAGRQMSELIEDLLAFSQMGRSTPELSLVDLSRVAEDARSTTERELEESGAQIVIEGPLLQVQGSVSALTIAVTNLLRNAVKFVAPGRAPRIRISNEARGRLVRLWVDDNGIGVDPAFHERIFQPFERLHRADAYPGTGIGLALVRRAAERSGGRAGVDSVLGGGSRFWLDLPAAVSEAAS